MTGQAIREGGAYIGPALLVISPSGWRRPGAPTLGVYATAARVVASVAAVYAYRLVVWLFKYERGEPASFPLPEIPAADCGDRAVDVLVMAGYGAHRMSLLLDP